MNHHADNTRMEQDATLEDTQVQLDMLIRARIRAKRDEDAAIERRREVDQAILGLLPSCSATTRVGDVKVVTTYGVTRKVDSDKLKAAFAELTAVLQGVFRWKAEVNEAAFKALDDEGRLIAAGFVSSKDAAPSLRIEL